MPKFLEDKIKNAHGAKSDMPHKVMNKMGAMHGSKETAKGEMMDAKHAADLHAKKKKLLHAMMGR